MKEALPAAYFVFLNMAALTEVWPIALDDPLPTVPVPLLPGDDDVPLGSQAAFGTTYDLLGYDLAVNYSEPREVPLKGGAAAWAESLLGRVR